jgi:hypothetical protein
MGRNKAAFTQSDVCRILNASRKTGVNVRVTLPDGTIIQTTSGDARESNENIPTNDFEALLNDKAAAQVRQ